jgi:hypothetical protein
MQKPLPARPSLEQLKKQAKELVKSHRAQDASTLALIREFLPSLAGKTDEEIVLYPFALHDAQSVMARQYGFLSWNQLRDHVEKLDPNATPRFTPEPAVEAKFRVVCKARETNDYDLWCSVMDEGMRTGIPKERFELTNANIAPWFKAEYTSTYMGELIERENHVIHFWRVSAPGQSYDLLVRMGIKNDLVSGLLFSRPFDTAIGLRK